MIAVVAQNKQQAEVDSNLGPAEDPRTPSEWIDDVVVGGVIYCVACLVATTATVVVFARPVGKALLSTVASFRLPPSWRMSPDLAANLPPQQLPFVGGGLR